MIDIVIPVHNALTHFRAMITSLNEHTARDSYRLIVVDDASDGRTGEFIETLGADVLIRNNSQLWFTRTVNRGLDATVCPLVAVLNTDIVLCPGWMGRLAGYFDDPRVMLAGSDHFPPQKGVTYPVRPHYLTGHCWMIRRWFMEHHGTLDENQIHIGSDRTFSWRVTDLGYKVVRDVELPVLHGTGPSWNRNLAALPQRAPTPARNRNLAPAQ